MVTIACPNCSKRLNAPAEAIGKKGRCTSCGKTFVLSAPPPAEPAEIVLEPVDAPSKKRLPRSAVISLWCAGVAVVFLSVAALITHRYVVAISETSVDPPPAAQPPQKRPASSPSLPALDATAPGSAPPATAAPQTVDEELQQFAKMPADKALQVYFEALTQEVNIEEEREPLRDKARQAYLKECESVFRSRIPKDLEDVFQRLRDRSVRQKRVLEVAKMPGPERAAALAKDSAEEQRIWKLRRQFDDEVNDHKILGFVNFVNTNETAQPLKTLETKLQQLQTKIDKYEANLFPRLTHDQIAEARRLAYVYMRPDENRLKEFEKTRDEMTTASLLKELEVRAPPELAAAARRWANPDATRKRLQEILELPSSREQEAAREKDAEEGRKLEKIWDVINEEITWMGAPLAVQIELDAANDIRKKCAWQKEKCDRHRARSKKLEESLNATFGQ
jgi:hypothetical protein